MTQTYEYILPTNKEYNVKAKAPGYYEQNSTIISGTDKTLNITLEKIPPFNLSFICNDNSADVTATITFYEGYTQNIYGDITFYGEISTFLISPNTSGSFNVTIPSSYSVCGLNITGGLGTSLTGSGCTVTNLSEYANENYYRVEITNDNPSITAILYDLCLTGDTLISISPYATKRLDEIEVGDKIVALDVNTGKLTEDIVISTDKDKNKSYIEYDLWKFSNDYYVKTVRKHRFYNVEDGCFKYMNEWKIGEHTIDIHGNKLKLLSHELIKEEVKHYKITTKKHHNYFANGMLTGSRYAKPINYKDIHIDT